MCWWCGSYRSTAGKVLRGQVLATVAVKRIEKYWDIQKNIKYRKFEV